MSKMKELAAVLDELVTCGEALISTANSLRDIFSGDEIRALLGKFGAKQLKQVDPSDYAALVTAAESIGTDCHELINGV